MQNINFKHVISLSQGKYFKRAAYDDECHSAFLYRCVKFLESAPDTVAMVYPQAELTDEEGKVIKASSFRIRKSAAAPPVSTCYLGFELLRSAMRIGEDGIS